MLFVAGVRWSHLAGSRRPRSRSRSRCSGCCRRPGVERAQALPGGTPHRLHASRRTTRAGATYNLTQSITAVGAGGLRGRGVVGATQTGLNYLPEHATDFAFASLAEQRGFFGASILLLLYLLVVWRGLKIVAGARDLFCAIVAGGIVFMFLFQVFVNVGMTMGIAPITGIPLPFVSVGGSSMITNLLAIGDPAGDPRAPRRTAARMRRVRKLGPLAVLRSSGSCAAAAAIRARSPSRARASSYRCSRGSCAPAARPARCRGPARRRGRARLDRRADERARSARPRAGVPIVAVTEGETLPYVLATDIVRVAPGAGLPGRARSPRRSRGGSARTGPALAARLPVLRARGVRRADPHFSRRNGLIGAAIFVPGVDMPVLTLNQMRLVLRIALAHGEPVDTRAGARARRRRRRRLRLPRPRARAARPGPVAGWAVKGAIAYAGTRAIGEAAVRYFEARSRLRPDRS